MIERHSASTMPYDRQLPPLSVAPILHYYDLDLNTVATEHLLEPPVDDRGVVLPFETLAKAMALVDPEYKWPRVNPEPDVHHFVWARQNYHPSKYSGSRIPRDYRNIPFHMGYIPRPLHTFIHATINSRKFPILKS